MFIRCHPVQQTALGYRQETFSERLMNESLVRLEEQQIKVFKKGCDFSSIIQETTQDTLSVLIRGVVRNQFTV